MKQIHITLEDTEMELVKNLLESAGLPCELRPTRFTRLLPAVPHQRELWILRLRDYLPAMTFCRNWLVPRLRHFPHKSCLACGEPMNAGFAACWHCGGKLDIPAENPVVA